MKASSFVDGSRRSALGCVAALLFTAVAILTSSPATADGADAVVAELQSQDYLVQINWLNGFDVAPLARCTVVEIHNPNNASDAAGGTVYVDVRCPNGWDD
ncbi:hypothetical protein BH09ACT8_BH09ACT8_05120 [soil metagenome]